MSAEKFYDLEGREVWLSQINGRFAFTRLRRKKGEMLSDVYVCPTDELTDACKAEIREHKRKWTWTLYAFGWNKKVLAEWYGWEEEKLLRFLDRVFTGEVTPRMSHDPYLDGKPWGKRQQYILDNLVYNDRRWNDICYLLSRSRKELSQFIKP